MADSGSAEEGHGARVQVGAKRKQENMSRSGYRSGYNPSGIDNGSDKSRPGSKPKCYYCLDHHAGGWAKCKKRAKNDPHWKPDFC